ncbi:MAG: Flp pilus assembly protein CpaB [Bacillota bacterium]
MARLREYRHLLLALGLALVAGLNVYSYLADLQLSGPVVVTAANIEAGSVLTPAMVRTSYVHPEAIHPLAFRDRQAAVGRVALVPMVAGEQVLVAKTSADPTYRGLGARIPPELRAVYVPATGFRGLAGALVPGERVDVVYVSSDLRLGVANAVTVVWGAMVLDVRDERGGRYDGTRDSSPGGLILLVTPVEAEKLAFCLKTGSLFVSLAPLASSPP